MKPDNERLKIFQGSAIGGCMERIMDIQYKNEIILFRKTYVIRVLGNVL